MLQQYSRHTTPVTAAYNKTACKDKLFCREKSILFVQKASIFVKSNEKETKTRRFFSNFGTFMYLSLRRPLSAKEKSMLFHP